MQGWPRPAGPLDTWNPAAASRSDVSFTILSLALDVKPACQWGTAGPAKISSQEPPTKLQRTHNFRRCHVSNNTSKRATEADRKKIPITNRRASSASVGGRIPYARPKQCER